MLLPHWGYGIFTQFQPFPPCTHQSMNSNYAETVRFNSSAILPYCNHVCVCMCVCAPFSHILCSFPPYPLLSRLIYPHHRHPEKAGVM